MIKLLGVILGGIGTGLCPAPLNWWWLGWVGLVPLWWGIRGAELSHSLVLGMVWGGCYHGLALFWLTGVHPLDWLGVPWLASLAIAFGVWGIVVAWGAVLVGIWAMGMGGVNGLSPMLRIPIGMALFCALEQIWSWSPLYWTALGYTQSPNNLVILQLGKLSGQQAITASIVGFNGLVAELLLNFSLRLGIWGLLLGLATIGYGVWQLNLPLEETGGIRVGLIQGNISNRVKFSPQGTALSLERYRAGYAELARSGVDVVVTPEGALPFGGPGLYRSVADLLQIYDVPIWLGGQGLEPNTNSLILWEANPEPIARYNKVKLVPIGEYVPQIIEGLVKRLSPLEGEFTPGNPNQIIDTPWGRWILGICYESAYPEHFRRQARWGGELMLTASNNAHYAPAMPLQHHAQDVARAIETDRYAVRVTNTGYSAIVDPRGRTLWRSGLDSTEIYSTIVYRRQTETLYVKYGDWLSLVLTIGSTFFYWKAIFYMNFIDHPKK